METRAGRNEEALGHLREGSDLAQRFDSAWLAALAAHLAGAAEGLRERSGIRTWPMMRYLEAEVAAEGRQALGARRFDQGFTAGRPLTQREAVAQTRALRDAGAPEQRR